MQTLTDSGVLDLWERGQDCGPTDRALLMLGVAQPTFDPERSADLPIGARDAALMHLRRANFGRWLTGCVACPECREQLEFNIDIEKVLPEPCRPSKQVFVASNGLRFRLPASRDLIAIERSSNTDFAARLLLQRCCLDTAAAESWPDAFVAEVDAGLLAADSFADIEIRFDCVTCGKRWAERLDIATWLWDEIELRARQLLNDVHHIAACYGWSEEEILNLSAARRTAYLDRCAI